MLQNIGDKRTRKQIARKIDRLKNSPNQQGKPLQRELAGLRSTSAASRYRIVYRVENIDSPDEIEGQAVILGIGIRKHGGRDDIYRLMMDLIM
jgi:Txe/YoeB family toxin of Txe-Axe toxin-antitoxin module